MEESVLASLAASIVGGVIVAFTNHVMTRRRETETRFVELRIEHLIECWSKIERAALVPASSTAESRSAAYGGMDDAIARITLLGITREIEIASIVAEKLSKGQSAAVLELLNELRANLREELGLAKVPRMKDLFFRTHREKE